MKLQNVILSGAVKFEKKPVKGLEERNTNLRPLTTPPGFASAKLENFFLNHKTYQAVINLFEIQILDSEGNFESSLDELAAGQADLVAKQFYFNCFLISWLGCTEDVGTTNNTKDRKNHMLPSFKFDMKNYNFPEYDGEDPIEFSTKFIQTLYKIPSNTIINPYFALFLIDKYENGLFYVESSPLLVRNASGALLHLDEPKPFSLEPGPGKHRPSMLFKHPQSYLVSYYQAKGKLERTRMAFKAIIEALTNRFEESQPFLLQSGYTFEAKVVNQHKIHISIKVATTPKAVCDPFWEHFGLANANIFDIHQSKPTTTAPETEIIDPELTKIDLLP